MLWQHPFRFKLPLGKTGFKQRQVHVGTRLTLVGDMKFTTIGVLAYYRALNLVFFRKLHERLQILRFYRHRHAFLTLRYPDFPEIQSFVF